MMALSDEWMGEKKQLNGFLANKEVIFALWDDYFVMVPAMLVVEI